MKRSELSLILAIVAIGFALRAALPSHMSVEHFDEGVYASNLFCGHLDPPFAYPDRALYAPPLLPALLEWVLLLSGGETGGLMWVNVIAGSLTVAAVWWVTRAWFGAGAALAAAVLAATSEYHIAFSRMALTDVLLCLWMLLGVYAGGRAILTGRPLWIGLAGLLAGLAWCTKYNGWLTLAVTGSGSAAWMMFSRPGGVRWSQAVFRWGGSALIAGVFFWVVAVQPLGPGGYAAVSANHAKYFVGLGGWWDGLLRHLAAHRFINGGVTYGGLFLASFLIWFRSASPSSRVSTARPDGPGLNGSLIAVIAARRLGTWMTAAWFIGLLLAVPLYHPYPRLSLPLLVVSWIGAGAAGQWILQHLAARRSATGPSATAIASAGDKPHRDRRRVLGGTAAALAVAVALAIGTGALSARRGTAWEDHGGIRDVAPNMLADVSASLRELPPSADPDLDAVIYVYADPAAFFNLAANAAEHAPRLLVHPAGNLGMTEAGATRRPVAGVFLVTGPRAHRDPAAIDAVAERLELVAAYAYQPSDLVRLDEFPAAALRDGTAPAERFRLWRVTEGP